MPDIRKNIANNILKYRKAKGLSQKELADSVGVRNITTVSSWERGANSPDIKVIFELCKLFNISVDDMFGVTYEKDIRDNYAFVQYLKSIGYAVIVEKTGESEAGYWEEHKEGDVIVGRSRIADEESFEVTLTKGKISAAFTDTEFKILQTTNQDTLEGLILLQSQKNKKEPPSAITENGSDKSSNENTIE